MSRTFIALTFAAVLLAAAPAAAQQRPEPPLPRDPAERQADFERCFAEGLEAITRRDLETSERLFRRCIALFPEQPVSYYNLACTLALAEKVDAAVQALRDSFAHGWIDLPHMSRDMDLDPIRRTPQFRALVSELEATLLGPCGPALSHVPEAAPQGLLVWVHDQGADPARDLERLRELLPTWAILVPQGLQARSGVAWDRRVEFVVVERLRAFVAAQGARLGGARAVVAGDGVVAVEAVRIAVHYPELVAGVAAAGPHLGAGVDEDTAPSGTRAYLIVHGGDPAQLESAVEARDRFVKAGSAVVVERYPLSNALSQDRAVVLRALAWLGGQDVQLPGAGAERTF